MNDVSGKVLFIDAPSASGKTRYINKLLNSLKAQGKRTLLLSDRDMCDMIISTARLDSKGITDTPLLSFELDFDVVAVEDVDVSLAGKMVIAEEFCGFAERMVKKGGTVIISGINLLQKTPMLCESLEKYSLWIPREEL